jgi:hypothetical protein
MQNPAVRGTAKSADHKSNVLDLIKQMMSRKQSMLSPSTTTTRKA